MSWTAVNPPTVADRRPGRATGSSLWRIPLLIAVALGVIAAAPMAGSAHQAASATSKVSAHHEANAAARDASAAKAAMKQTKDAARTAVTAGKRAARSSADSQATRAGYFRTARSAGARAEAAGKHTRHLSTRARKAAHKAVIAARGHKAAAKWAHRASRSAAHARRNAKAAEAADGRARRWVAVAKAVADAGQPCGGQRPAKPGGGHWDCSFDDEFGGSVLDRTKWLPVKTASIGFHSGPECYVDSDRTVSVSGGSLHLTVTKAPAPLACAVETTPYLSGMVTSNGLFAQKYGRFEVRAKLPQGVGLQSALWLYPQALAYGPWPDSGEIDIAEAYGAFPDVVQPHLHYEGPLNLAMAPGGTCVVLNPDTEFHTYTVAWTPSAITFVYDGHTCVTMKAWTPQAPQHHPAPFDQPFEINLQLALGNGTPNLVSDTLTPFPSSLTVDWVRVWK